MNGSEPVTRLLKGRLDEARCWLIRAKAELPGWFVEGAELEHRGSWADGAKFVHLTHPEITIPDRWDPSGTRLRLDVHGLGWIRLSSRDGSATLAQVDDQHTAFLVPGRRFAVECALTPASSGGYTIPEDPWGASLVLVDDDVRELVARLELAMELAGSVPDEAFARRLLDVCADAAHLLEWPSATREYISRVAELEYLTTLWTAPALQAGGGLELSERQRASVREATALLRARLAELKGERPPGGEVAFLAYNHVDIAWLWPKWVTRELAPANFSTLLSTAGLRPHLAVGQSSAELYSMVAEDDPALFERIVRSVKRGAWTLLGGMWVEPDGNVPSGESWCRQLLHGQGYFTERFGRRARIGWLPDSFGLSPALPGLLRSAGLDYFFATKLRKADTNAFPYDWFWWEGLDGTRILSHVNHGPRGYLGTPSAELLERVCDWRRQAGMRRVLQPLGYSKGSGPSESDLDRAAVIDEMPNRARVCTDADPEQYFAAAAQAAATANLPVWRGELYLEAHRGTYTAQGRTKYWHRHAEHNIVAAETLRAMETMRCGTGHDPLDEMWERLLACQSHDVAAGSCITEVHTEAEHVLRGVSNEAEHVADRSAQMLARACATAGGGPDALVVCNPTLQDRKVRLETSMPVPGAQRVEDGWVFAAGTTAPGMAIRHAGGEPVPAVVAGDGYLENAYVRVSIADDGALSGLLDKANGRQVLSGRGNRLVAYRDHAGYWDAWEVSAQYSDQAVELDAPASVEVVERGPYRAAVRVRRSFRDSTVCQTIRLWANSPRVEFRTDFDWHDRRWMVRAHFRLADRPTRAVTECAFGVIERDLGRNTSWQAARFEVPGHRFMDVGDEGYGVALLNDGRYGYACHEDDMSLCLLRSPVFPDPYADEGQQTLTYALMPHAGSWAGAGVLAEAQDLNRPLYAAMVPGGESCDWRALHVTGHEIALSALKPPRSGRPGLVMRAYEPHGAAGTAHVRADGGWVPAAELDVLERDLGAPRMRFPAFGVHTWMLGAPG